MHAELEFSSYAGAIQGLVERIIENSDAAIFLGDMIEASDPLLAQSTTVCFLSLLMGLKLDAYLVTERARIDPRGRRTSRTWGSGALFHDIGVLRFGPLGALSGWTRTLDKNDAGFSATLLWVSTRCGKIPTAAAAVLHHHQRMDGSGYQKQPRLQEPAQAAERERDPRLCADHRDGGAVRASSATRRGCRHGPGAAGLDARRGVSRVARTSRQLRRVLDLVWPASSTRWSSKPC